MLEPILAGQPLQDFIAKQAAAVGATLSEQGRIWLTERAESYLRNYAQDLERLGEQLRGWAVYTAEPVDMEGVVITVGAWVLAPFKSGGHGGGACMKRLAKEEGRGQRAGEAGIAGRRQHEGQAAGRTRQGNEGQGRRRAGGQGANPQPYYH